MRLHQVLSGAGPYDAITREALAVRDLVGTWGWAGEVYAAAIDPRVGRREIVIAARGGPTPGPQDLVEDHRSHEGSPAPAAAPRP